ncbi:glycosyltransferase [Halospina sp. K52047b]|uniref:glycosyltransferase family 4 protein n=1 Tax=Halospina sp. K52047b TaxID=2614160 RepID=UPI001249F18E|nr:glycosyltransferase [Halospina sp. K52047b]KAA8976812.1 glycosyltransferase [Halospina sp. K52047b]
MTKITVCHLSSVHDAGDARIALKECATLASAGFHVTLVAPGVRESVPAMVNFVSFSRYSSRLRRFLLGGIRMWRVARAQSADVYHFHDPELLLVGLLLKLQGARVIYDAHENVPAQIRAKSYIRVSIIRRFIAVMAAAVEQASVRVLDGVVAAAPSIVRRFPESKVTLVRNYPRVEKIQKASAAPAPEFPMAIYAGTLSEARGVLDMVRAVGTLEGTVRLWLAGQWHDESFQRRCEAEEGWRFTEYLGRVPAETVYGLMKSATVGLHCPRVSPNHSDGLAVKVFEYMASGLPFVSTDEPAKRANFAGTALFSQGGDPNSIAEQIRKLVEDPALGAELGAQGLARIAEGASWEGEGERLVAFYRNILGRGELANRGN